MSNLPKLVDLTPEECEAVSGGISDKWAVFPENGGGNVPKGEANGVPDVVENPGGNRPPGQQV